MKSIVEWAEKEKARGRRLMMFSTIFTFLFVTVGMLAAGAFGIAFSDVVTSIYIAFSTVAGGVFAFYTSTNADTD